mmetsp:Transcript_34919/g.76998  ORF Transcript_34919/g.76998 Transcript_34919/m.76998 type:complete len:217 (-) Transcript_34919:476-1126(-)
MATAAAVRFLSGSSPYASSTNSTPPVALPISCATLSAPILASFSPVVSTNSSVRRTPSSFSAPPNSRATVVLPVPGFPRRQKLCDCLTRSRGLRCSASTLWYTPSTCSFTAPSPTSPMSLSMEGLGRANGSRCSRAQRICTLSGACGTTTGDRKPGGEAAMSRSCGSMRLPTSCTRQRRRQAARKGAWAGEVRRASASSSTGASSTASSASANCCT